MSNAEDNERLLIARCGLGLFVAGLLVPFVIIVSFDTYTFALTFGIIALLLALLFGGLGWQHLSGKIAATGSILLSLVLLIAAAIRWLVAMLAG